MYVNVLNQPIVLNINEDKGEYKNRVQLDEIMKKLFYIHNNRPIIDLLNSLYGDNIGYEAKISYLNKEAINQALYRNAFLISEQCDMFIKVDFNNKSYEYLLEFQTRNDKNIAIRLFRYSFDLKFQGVKELKRKGTFVINLPNPYVIVLEENNSVPELYEFIINTPNGQSLKYSSKVLKYWEYDLDKLYKNNLYLLYPLKVFEVRKKIDKVKNKKLESQVYDRLIIEIKDDIFRVTREIAQHIDDVYKEKKIDESEYNEFGVIIANLSLYLCREVDKLSSIDKEVSVVIKTLYDPEVEKRGRKFVAANMIKDGDSNDKIKRCTGLDENEIIELRKSLEPKGEH